MPEVVRESKMHFEKVPRLGCYMAIPLVYDSCLFNEALEEAVEDYTVVSKEKEEQDKQRAEYEEQQASIRDEKEKAGEPYEEEDPPEWKVIEFAPFKTFKEEYVVCLDTLGQDRQFSDDEKRFTLETVMAYKDAWEKQEVASLTADRDRKLALLNPPVEGEGIGEVEQQQEKEVTEAMESIELDNDYFEPNLMQDDAVLKEIMDNQKTLMIEAKCFTEKEEWIQVLRGIKEFRVLKMPHIIQALFFLNKFPREQICEPNSNKLSWKKAKELLVADLPLAMAEYTVWGEKTDEFRPYMRLNYVEGLTSKYTQEEVDAYHPGMGKLFKWL